MSTISLRSTAVLTEFVHVTDQLAAHQLICKKLTIRESELRPDVLAEIGERRAITVRGQVRVLRPETQESVKRTCSDLAAVEFCQAVGLKTHERSASYVAPAAFSSYVRQGKIDSSLYAVETTTIVLVD